MIGRRFRDTDYQVFKDGTVIGPRGIPLKGDTNASGYNQITISIDGVRRKFYRHRMVAECWIPNPDNKPEVAHLDDIKLNCESDNLEWATRAENSCKYAFVRKLTKDNVIYIKDGLKRGVTASSLARKFNVDKSTICQIKQGKIHKGVA